MLAKISNTPTFHFLLGDNIACHSNANHDDVSENLGTYVDRFCWIAGLYLSPESYGAGRYLLLINITQIIVVLLSYSLLAINDQS